MKRRDFLKGVLGVAVMPSLPMATDQYVMLTKWVSPMEIEKLYPAPSWPWPDHSYDSLRHLDEPFKPTNLIGRFIND